MIVDKRKHKEDRVQDKEVFLYKPYDILLKLNRLKTSEPKFIQDEVNNLEKAIILMQSPTRMMPFYPPPNYKTLQPNGEQKRVILGRNCYEIYKTKTQYKYNKVRISY